MSEMSLEFNSLLGPPPLVSSAAPTEIVANERGFRDHLDQVRNRTPYESPTTSSAYPNSDSAATSEERDWDESSVTATDNSAADARNEDRETETDDSRDEIAAAETGFTADPVGNANSKREVSTNANAPSDEQIAGKHRVRLAGEKRLTTKPRPEHFKQQQSGKTATVENDGEPVSPKDFAKTNAASTEVTELGQPKLSKSASDGTDKLTMVANTKTADAHALEASAETGEEIDPETRAGEAVAAAHAEVSNHLTDDVSLAAPRARPTQAKQQTGVRTPTAANSVAAIDGPTPSASELATEVMAIDQITGLHAGDKEQISEPPSETPHKSSIRQDDRAIAAPTLLTSKQDDVRQTTVGGQGVSEFDRVRLVQRVARAFHSIGEEGGEMQLRLRPPELGSLRLEITVRGGVMTAQLETETAAARNLLLDNLPLLRDRLAEQNVKVERFDVNVRDDAQQRNDQPYEGQPEVPRPSRRNARQLERTARAVSAGSSLVTHVGRDEGPGKLNIVI